MTPRVSNYEKASYGHVPISNSWTHSFREEYPAPFGQAGGFQARNLPWRKVQNGQGARLHFRGAHVALGKNDH
jgi:hypothetical protein